MGTEAVKNPADEPSEPQAAETAVAPKPIRRYRAWIFQGYVVAAAIGFGALFGLARTVPYFQFDLRIALLLQRMADLPVFGLPFDLLMAAVSWIGYLPQAVYITGLVVIPLFLIGLRWEALCAFAASVGSSTFATLAKIIVGRPRPTEDLVRIVQRVGEFSFPSGHVVFYAAFIGFLLFLSFTLLKKGVARFVTIVLLASLLVLVGPSRIYLGAHWPSDVLGAYLLGSLCLVAIIYIYRWGKPRFFVRQPPPRR